jgi:alkylation response protein AidB-like acyl-CoA dehydrogenase
MVLSYLCVSDFLLHIPCLQVALDAIQILGGNGYINDYPTGRYLRYEKSVLVPIRATFFSFLFPSFLVSDIDTNLIFM